MEASQAVPPPTVPTSSAAHNAPNARHARKARPHAPNARNANASPHVHSAPKTRTVYNSNNPPHIRATSNASNSNITPNAPNPYAGPNPHNASSPNIHNASNQHNTGATPKAHNSPKAHVAPNALNQQNTNVSTNANNVSKAHSAPNAPNPHNAGATPNTNNASIARSINSSSNPHNANAPNPHSANTAPNAPNAPNAPGPANSPRHKQKQAEGENDKLKVHVSGFPPYTQSVDIVRVFSKFGTVRVEKFNQRFSYAVLAFSAEKEAKAAINASKIVNIYGEFLAVRQWTQRDNKQPKRDFTRTKQRGAIVDPKDINLTGDFHSQLDTLLATVRLTQEEALAVSALFADVEQVLQALWPGCVTMPFGSITTGLGIKSSDADCFVHVPAVFQAGQHTFVSRARRALLQHPAVFSEILAIPRANTPIVKFFHEPTATNCDLSFKTPLGTRNSKLIAFLLHADARLLPAAVAAKYWAKAHALTGTGKLTNYALTMMIVFYLQQPPDPVLPAVRWLQQDPAYDLIVDYWNTGFIDKQELLPPSTNTSSIADLLGGFFEFYSKFNFEEMIVCPYLGTPVKKEAFVDITKIPKEFDRYTANTLRQLTPPLRASTSMCVQDPFEQSHNVASAVSNKLAMEIKTFFKFAADAYEKDKKNECKDFLKTILLQKPKIVRGRSNPEFKINLYPKVVTHIVEPDWKAVVRDVIVTVFETMLKINLGKIDEKVNPEAKKKKERFIGTITKPIWKRQQCAKLYMAMNLDFVEKQAKITEDILSVAGLDAFHLQFVLTVTFTKDPKNTSLAIKLANGEMNYFKEFGMFFTANMLNWMTTLLKRHNMPPPSDTPADIAEMIKSIDAYTDLDSDDDDDAIGENTTEDVDNGDTEGNDMDISEGVDNDVSESTDEDLAGAVSVPNHSGDNKGAAAKPPASTAAAAPAAPAHPAPAHTARTDHRDRAQTDTQSKS